jgi:hypothetical protein
MLFVCWLFADRWLFSCCCLLPASCLCACSLVGGALRQETGVPLVCCVRRLSLLLWLVCVRSCSCTLVFLVPAFVPAWNGRAVASCVLLVECLLSRLSCLVVLFASWVLRCGAGLTTEMPR